MNLKKMRVEDFSAKLIKAKQNDIWKHFMDQDALNLVFDENVSYVSPKWNYMYGNMLSYSKQ